MSKRLKRNKMDILEPRDLKFLQREGYGLRALGKREIYIGKT